VTMSKKQLLVEIPSLFLCEHNPHWKESNPYGVVGISKTGTLLLKHYLASEREVAVGVRKSGEFEKIAVIHQVLGILDGDISELVLPFQVMFPTSKINQTKVSLRGFKNDRFIFFRIDKNGTADIRSIYSEIPDEECAKHVAMTHNTYRSYIQCDNEGGVLNCRIKAQDQERFRELF
jgi:hypothetical protein